MTKVCAFCGKELGIFDRNTLLAGNVSQPACHAAGADGKYGIGLLIGFLRPGRRGQPGHDSAVLVFI